MLVSAVIADGPPRRVLEVLADGAAELVLPAPVPEELRRVLAEKLGLSRPATDEILGLIEEATREVAAAPERVEKLSGDADDDRILAAAAAARVAVLISGDRRHLLPLGSHRGMRIVTPQQFLAELAPG